MYKFIANGIKVNMFVGICDFEYLKKQEVIVNVSVWGDIPLKPKNIDECLDYSKVCFFVKSWEDREHVDLVETLLFDVLNFCFEQDSRILTVEAEILKPQILDFTNYVGVSNKLNRSEFKTLRSRFQ
jgi:FolB domain-containing protein